jgi:hypothetical protein
VVNWRQIEKKVASDEGGNGEGMGSSWERTTYADIAPLST